MYAGTEWENTVACKRGTKRASRTELANVVCMPICTCVNVVLAGPGTCISSLVETRLRICGYTYVHVTHCTVAS